MYLVAWGLMGLGDWIWEIERGRPLGMSTVRLSRLECLDEECFDDEWWDDEEDLCLEVRDEEE